MSSNRYKYQDVDFEKVAEMMDYFKKSYQADKDTASKHDAIGELSRILYDILKKIIIYNLKQARTPGFKEPTLKVGYLDKNLQDWVDADLRDANLAQSTREKELAQQKKLKEMVSLAYVRPGLYSTSEGEPEWGRATGYFYEEDLQDQAALVAKPAQTLSSDKAEDTTTCWPWLERLKKS